MSNNLVVNPNTVSSIDKFNPLKSAAGLRELFSASCFLKADDKLMDHRINLAPEFPDNQKNLIADFFFAPLNSLYVNFSSFSIPGSAGKRASGNSMPEYVLNRFTYNLI